jgi:zinc protease
LNKITSSIDFPEVHSTLFELSNGITLIVAEQRGVEVASVQAWCETGSIHEGKWLGAGLTHLLEHVLFNGTERRSSKQISEEIHSVGGYLNAYTSFDRTVFWIDCPGHAVRQSIDLLGDMIFCSRVDAETLDREMDVIRREVAMGLDDPERLLSHLTFANAYQVHPCRYPVIGIRDVFDQLTHANVLEYYRRRYLPNNLYLVVTGDVDSERIRSEVEELWSIGKRRALEPVLIPEEPPQLGRREGTQLFAGEIAYFGLGWHIPAISHRDIPPLDLLGVILGGGTSSRLNQELRERQGSVYGIGASAYTPGFPGLLTVSGTCSPKYIDSVQSRVIGCVNGWRKNRFSAEELKRAKRMVTVSAIEQLQTVKGLATDVGLNWHYTRNLNFSREYLKVIQSVSETDLERVAERYLTESNLTVTTLRAERGNKISRAKKRVQKESELCVFPHGQRIVLIPDYRLPMIYTSMVFRGGCIAENARDNGIHRLIARAMVKGTKSRSAEQIAGEIEGMGGTLYAESGYNSVRVSASSLSIDFADAIELMLDVTKNPVFPEEATSRERESQIADLHAEKVQAQSIARNLLRAAIYEDHPYGMNPNGTEEIVRRLPLADLHRKHDECFVQSEAVLAVCGDFDRNRMLEQAEAALEELQPATPRETRELLRIKPFEQRIITAHEGKHQAIVHIGFLACSLADPDRESLELFDQATGDSSSRFFLKIREELGLAYSVGSSFFVGLVPGIYSVRASVAPEKVPEVVDLIRQELNQFALHGLAEGEFGRAKTRILAQLAFQTQNLEAYAHGAALNELYGLGFDHIRERQRQIERLTLATVNGVIGKYLMDKPAITVIVTP